MSNRNNICFLSIDLGTTNVKVLIVDIDGKILASASGGYKTFIPEQGYAEQNPLDWWNATVKAVKQVVETAGIKPEDVKGIGLTGQTHGTVLLDENLEPLCNGITWMDLRARNEVKYLENNYGRQINSICGLPISTGFTGTTLLWFKNNRPDIWEKVHKFLLPKDYIRFMLTGKLATDVTDAGGSLLLDVEKRKWSEEIFNILNISSEIAPDIYESTDVAGSVTGETAKLLGLAEGTPVFGGGADHIMAAVGNNLMNEGDGVSVIGTGALVMTPVTKISVTERKGLHICPYVMRDKWILMGAILSGGICVECFKNLLSLDRENFEEYFYNELIEHCSDSVPGSGGLIFLPYLQGERTPHMDPAAKGAFIGLTPKHKTTDLVRAVMEGVVFGLRDCLELLKKNGADIENMIVTGGGAKNEIWKQIQTDVFDLPLSVTSTQEGSAYGAAIIAAAGSEYFSGVEDVSEKWIECRKDLQPIRKNVEIYNKVYRIFTKLYPNLKEQFNEISNLYNN